MKDVFNVKNTQGEFTFEGVHVSQTPMIVELFNRILPNFDRIIEIGTYNGGLTLFLFKNKKETCELISYDINPNFNRVPQNYNIDFRIGDCFSNSTKNEIINLISDKSKRVLLLCDGGYKNEEFNLFSEYIKFDDVIMLHDFSESLEDFEMVRNNIGWIYQSESNLNSIKDAISKYGLSQYYYNDFKNALWGSFIKNKNSTFK